MSDQGQPTPAEAAPTGVSPRLFGRVVDLLDLMYGDRLASPADINAMVQLLGDVERLYRRLPTTPTPKD